MMRRRIKFLWHNFLMKNLEITITQNIARVYILGPWTKEFLTNYTQINQVIFSLTEQCIIFNFSKCESIDSAGAIEFLRLKNYLLSNQKDVSCENLIKLHKKFLDFFENNFQSQEIKQPQPINYLEYIGLKTITYKDSFLQFFTFVGELFIAFFKTLANPKSFRFSSFIFHIDQSILKAMPIVALLSLLIGIVVAFQSSQYLVKVNADIFVVDLSVMSVFRELSPMITAILVASRSASAFAAQIGTMKITEEIDAMKVAGFDPFVFLVLPRFLALTIALPFLFFIADMAGLLGTFIVANLHLGISVDDFFERMYEQISINEFYVGFFRAPLYGAIIALVGCYRGFEVQNDTHSIGKYTTKSVVDAIFWIIICDCIIAVALTRLGI